MDTFFLMKVAKVWFDGSAGLFIFVTAYSNIVISAKMTGNEMNYFSARIPRVFNVLRVSCAGNGPLVLRVHQILNLLLRAYSDCAKVFFCDR